ncbi:MAG TPA: STAS domain-containing protein [Tepidisphaeraceae bacterium]|jgi:rsbT co-antagonist protein RsbR|nr:STAS domain-containing protein [Tepidisphaeraceae bacterium]
MAAGQSRTPGILKTYSAELLDEWLKGLNESGQDGRISASELRAQAREFLQLLEEASRHEDMDDLESAEWTPIREFLDGVSRSRAIQGFTSAQTATFIFSLKKPLFSRLQTELGNDGLALAAEMWKATELLDSLGLYTVKAFQKSREDIINRQQQEMLELSTPVVKLWEGVLALPMIGTLDSARTQIVMESLLQRIVETGSEIAIIDITGVPTVDTLVAQHLLKTVTAIRLMGADCIISGIRPQIAQTIVHLGVDLQGVTTKATLADALTLALRRSGFAVTKNKV